MQEMLFVSPALSHLLHAEAERGGERERAEPSRKREKQRKEKEKEQLKDQGEKSEQTGREHEYKKGLGSAMGIARRKSEQKGRLRHFGCAKRLALPSN